MRRRGGRCGVPRDGRRLRRVCRPPDREGLGLTLMLGILYDVHGNLDALNAVLAEAAGEGIDEWLLGGDYCTFGPWPVETLARLRELPNETWLRGNGERWLVDPPLAPAGGPVPEGFGRRARACAAVAR